MFNVFNLSYSKTYHQLPQTEETTFLIYVVICEIAPWKTWEIAFPSTKDKNFLGGTKIYQSTCVKYNYFYTIVCYVNKVS